MGVTIEEAGQNGRLGKIDDFGLFRDGQVRADGFDLGTFDEDDLMESDRARRGIEKPAGLDGHSFSLSADGGHQEDKKKKDERIPLNPRPYFHLPLLP